MREEKVEEEEEEEEGESNSKRVIVSYPEVCSVAIESVGAFHWGDTPEPTRILLTSNRLQYLRISPRWDDSNAWLDSRLYNYIIMIMITTKLIREKRR